MRICQIPFKCLVTYSTGSSVRDAAACDVVHRTIYDALLAAGFDLSPSAFIAEDTDYHQQIRTYIQFSVGASGGWWDTHKYLIGDSYLNLASSTVMQDAVPLP